MRFRAAGTLCVTMFSLALVLVVTQANAVIDQKTIAGLWFFDENSGDTTADSSGNGNTGKLLGKADWTDGPFGSAIEFDGVAQSYVEIADSPSLQMEETLTVMFWVRNEKKMVDMFGDRQVPVGKHYTEYEVGIYTAGQLHTYTWGRPGADGYDEGILVGMNGKPPGGEGDWEEGKWFHVAWSLENKHEIAYVNGVMLGEYDKGTENTKPGNHTLDIGRRQGGSLPLTGAVDEVGVFNAVLDADQIMQAYELGLGVATGIQAVDPAGKLATTWGNVKAVR
ncbi:MAG: LamG domain-containing protein [Candidatus Poribacteria bacterium]|nr:LamG domain-containing protein [Candidatus Poribacteria bacterium]